MRVGYLAYHLSYQGNKTLPKEGARVHKSGGRRRWRWDTGPSAKCGAGNLTQGQWSVSSVPTDFDPTERVVFDELNQVARFLKGEKEIPEWVYEADLCRKCFPDSFETKKCNMGHSHKVKKRTVELAS